MTHAILMLSSLLVGAPADAAPGRTWLTPDFYVESVTADWLFRAPPTRRRVTDCRAHIADVVCVNEGRFERSAGASRDCTRDNAPYVTFFESVYDRFPPAFQQMFCSLSAINIEANLESVAYGGLQFGGAVWAFASRSSTKSSTCRVSSPGRNNCPLAACGTAIRWPTICRRCALLPKTPECKIWPSSSSRTSSVICSTCPTMSTSAWVDGLA